MITIDDGLLYPADWPQEFEAEAAGGGRDQKFAKTAPLFDLSSLQRENRAEHR